jgi:hypothetical protein
MPTILNKSKIPLLELVCDHHEIIDTESHCPRKREKRVRKRGEPRVEKR